MSVRRKQTQKRRKRPTGTRREVRDGHLHTELLTIAAKLQNNYAESLSPNEAVIAGSLIFMIAHDIDPRTKYFKTVPGVKPDPHHWDIALHASILLAVSAQPRSRGAAKTAYGHVAQAWGYRDTAIPAIVKAYRRQCAEIVELADARTRQLILAEIEARAKLVKTQ